MEIQTRVRHPPWPVTGQFKRTFADFKLHKPLFEQNPSALTGEERTQYWKALRSAECSFRIDCAENRVNMRQLDEKGRRLKGDVICRIAAGVGISGILLGVATWYSGALKAAESSITTNIAGTLMWVVAIGGSIWALVENGFAAYLHKREARYLRWKERLVKDEMGAIGDFLGSARKEMEELKKNN